MITFKTFLTEISMKELPPTLLTKWQDEHTRLHNEASKKYTEAFKKVGARMWHDDDCHPIQSNHQQKQNRALILCGRANDHISPRFL